MLLTTEIQQVSDVAVLYLHRQVDYNLALALTQGMEHHKNVEQNLAHLLLVTNDLAEVVNLSTFIDLEND